MWLVLTFEICLALQVWESGPEKSDRQAKLEGRHCPRNAYVWHGNNDWPTGKARTKTTFPLLLEITRIRDVVLSAHGSPTSFAWLPRLGQKKEKYHFKNDFPWCQAGKYFYFLKAMAKGQANQLYKVGCNYMWWEQLFKDHKYFSLSFLSRNIPM